MAQDPSTTSSTIVRYAQKEEVFSIPLGGFGVREGVSGEIERVIESTPTIQGGEYCLKGTRATVQGIIEAEKNGRSTDEIRRGLKKYFGIDRSVQELEQAKKDYKAEVGAFIDKYYDRQKNKTMR